MIYFMFAVYIILPDAFTCEGKVNQIIVNIFIVKTSVDFIFKTPALMLSQLFLLTHDGKFQNIRRSSIILLWRYVGLHYRRSDIVLKK